MGEYDLKRQLVHGMLSLVLGALAAWAANYLTKKILGEPEEKQLMG